LPQRWLPATEGEGLVEDLVAGFILTMTICLLVIPSVGAGILWQGFKIAKIPQFTFRQCWKVYLAACCYGYLLLMGARLLWQNNPDFPKIGMAVFAATTMLAVPLLLRNVSRRVVMVSVFAMLITDLLIVGAFFLFFQGARPADPPAGRALLSETANSLESESMPPSGS
jgi:hypothetical protein